MLKEQGRRWNRELGGHHTMRNALYPTESGPPGHKGDFALLKCQMIPLGEMSDSKSGAGNNAR